GVSTDQDVTTLGRGGSDTTAVALAGALGAHVCEIYTDVDGVYTADPRVVTGARKLTALSYEEMLELAAGGARVLQLRSVEYARRHGVRLHVRSSFSDEPGTWVIEEAERVEQALISGVAGGAAGHAVDDRIAKISLVGAGMKSNPSVVADMFEALAAEDINIEMISTSTIRISCVVRAEDADRAVRAVHDRFSLGDAVDGER